jgi:hypothetical protein
MTQEQIESNKIIAEFDGWEKRLSEKGAHSKTALWYKVDSGYAAFDLSAMKYHSSWDWLMPVIENIVLLEESEFNYDAEGMSQLRMSKLQFKALSITNSIDIIFNSVVAFCKWYNQNKQK